MVAAQAAFKSYDAEVAQYAECVSKQGGDDRDVKRTITLLEELAHKFNEELRAFKEKAGAK
jgi:hypothetical protein